MENLPSLPPLDVPGLLRQHDLRPEKRLGQNFLVDDVFLRKIIVAAGVTAQDVVLEVGPGLGSLTRYLGVVARQVIAVELDAKLVAPLGDVLVPYPNVRLVEGDILKIDPSQLIDASGYLVVANIPYYITSALIRHLLEADVRPQRMALTVQREVAQRITADPGKLSLLALSVQVYGQAHIVARIPAGAFYPIPKVDSSVVRVDLYPSPRISHPRLPDFFLLAKAGFSQKRKTLRNALTAGLGWQPSQSEALLHAAGIDPRRRAETLSLVEWSRLVDRYASQRNRFQTQT
jgi:16S rRNA (adenine1518-N6/adenine1519-N6)-dimethyltransferase